MKTSSVLGLVLLFSVIGGCVGVSDRTAYDPPAQVQHSRAPTIEELKLMEGYKKLGVASYIFGYKRGQCTEMVEALVERGPELLGPGRDFDESILSILQWGCERGRFDRIVGRRENPDTVVDSMNEVFLEHLNRS